MKLPKYKIGDIVEQESTGWKREIVKVVDNYLGRVARAFTKLEK